METDTIAGYFNNVCLALEKAGNFTIKKIKKEENYGTLDKENQTWSGAIGLIVNKKIDIALGFFTALPDEIGIIDYSARLIRVQYVIIIKKPEIKVLVSWSAYFENATESPLKEASELLVSENELPETNEQAIEKICKENMALFIDDMFLPIVIHNNVANICNLTIIPTGEFDDFSLILHKNSPYRSPIDYYIRRFHENGVLTLQNSAIYKNVKQYSFINFYKKHTPVTVLDVSVIFTILFSSVSASIIIFFYEKFHYWDERTRDYVNLISEISKWSKSTSVALLHFTRDDGKYTERNG
ncbi:uncharacterized protein LOC127289417 [Leptopilina boulardi]|uniref:uncharacterized protein LOC127289417 n=1 Tax=Leptopilina boulardi TaxID=63433 RepID=UPI0021F6130E|nr:uncharacterized protein LOC127289417 [Leptopilina boulardi]